MVTVENKRVVFYSKSNLGDYVIPEELTEEQKKEALDAVQNLANVFAVQVGRDPTFGDRWQKTYQNMRKCWSVCSDSQKNEADQKNAIDPDKEYTEESCLAAVNYIKQKIIELDLNINDPKPNYYSILPEILKILKKK